MNRQSTYHIPVLVVPVIEYLTIKPGGLYIDATFGGGGHTKAILDQEPTCKVIAFDWDQLALELNGTGLKEQYGDRLTLLWGNFSRLDMHLKKIGIKKVDGILADFGTSQYQIKERAGFSFATTTPLDMRMSPAHQKITAADLVNTATESELATIFWTYAQEEKSRQIARSIVASRPLTTTEDLVAAVMKAKWYDGKIHPATKVFQALRIFVNKELENIASFLPAAMRILADKAHLVCISFHSMEDRLVKDFYTNQARQGVLEILTPKGVVASEQELKENPSARSARLRAAKMIKSL
jgi:16S rRNA (cytosine1402-N4)-methyltransferase